VLVVDDDRRFAKLLATLLADAGYTPTIATSAAEAMAAARAEPPDVAVVDVVMPGRGGYSLCRDLREEVGAALPVVFVSGERADPMDRAAGIIAGGDDYLVKPIHAEELLARLERLLERSRGRSSGKGLDLTEREIEVLQLIAEGRPPADVARTLYIAPKTVASHIQRIFTKLGVHTRAQAVALAYEAGLIRVDATRHEVEAHLAVEAVDAA
jgi:DNA-binding NarL/FixJ family response regulator